MEVTVSWNPPARDLMSQTQITAFFRDEKQYPKNCVFFLSEHRRIAHFYAREFNVTQEYCDWMTRVWRFFYKPLSISLLSCFPPQSFPCSPLFPLSFPLSPLPLPFSNLNCKSSDPSLSWNKYQLVNQSCCWEHLSLARQVAFEAMGSSSELKI